MPGSIRVTCAVLAAACVFSGGAPALPVGEVVDNFRLLDHRGKSHELYYLSDMEAVVLLSHDPACEAARPSIESLSRLQDEFRGRQVAFLLIDTSSTGRRQGLDKAAAAAELPILLDDAQLIGESLGLAASGEALIIDPQSWKLVYRGAVERSGRSYVREGVQALLAQQPVATRSTRTGGCPLPQPDRKQRTARAAISYEKTIAPLLIDKCVSCHRPGGIGPWAMSSYQMVKGFAPMIREVVRTQRMPPWHADPHHGDFANDRGLSPEESRMLVHWIEAGAPAGDGADPLADLRKEWPTWALGEPDLIIDIPKFDVPATGTIPYQKPSVANPLDHDVWVRAVDFHPGDRSVLHHIIAGAGAGDDGIAEGGSLGAYVPGAGPMVLPEDAGILLAKGARLNFQMHYTTSGKATSDATRMGLYFRKDAPKYRYRTMAMIKPSLRIPAHDKAYTDSVSRVLQRDVLVYSFMPHAHFRGKAASFVARYPDGHEETLLSVPHYDFNWQTTYELSTPKRLPAGTRLTYFSTYDNSVQNQANPDPSRVVPWGQQSWDEMLFGTVRYRFMDE